MHNLLDLIRSLFQYGRGRPAALVILMWTTSISVISEIPLEDKTAQLTGNVTGAFTKARQFLFDGYQKYYPRTPLSQPVTIVAIDEKSLAELGQWPWPRNQLAELLDAIAGYGPAAVGLDMYMPEADQTSPPMLANRLPADTPEPVVAALRELPSNDAVLARSLHNMPSVLGAAGFDHASYTTSAGMRSHPLLVSGGEALPHVRRFPAVLASLPELQAAARGQAILSVDLDFGVVRRVPLIAAIGDTLVSGLAMEMLRLATGDRAVRVQVGSHGIDSVGIADLDVPTQPRGDVWLHFASIDATRHRYVSATSILDGSIDPDLMTGKLVMLGLTGSGLHDMRTTALGELVPGIEIQAQVLESLFDGRFIVRPWWMKWLETSIIVTLGLMLIWYIPRRNSRLSKFINAVPRASAWITLGINLLLIGVGYLAFRTQGLLFDASSFFLVISAVIGSLIASTVIELNRQEKADAAEAQRVREAANLIAGEFAATMDQPIHGSFGNTSPRIEQLTRELASMRGAAMKLGQILSMDTGDFLPRELADILARLRHPYIAGLIDGGTTTCLPVVIADDQPLVFRQWDGMTPLDAGDFGTMAPGPDAPVVTPNLILMPLAGFDASGNRLGYGKGFYDRTVAALNPRPQLIGYGFSTQQVDLIPAEPHDVRMDMVISELGMLKFT